jgi:uncharacterized protein
MSVQSKGIRQLLLGGLAVWVALSPLTVPIKAQSAAASTSLGVKADEEPQKAAIVIDDFGNHMSGTKEMMELPVPFTAAVMPFLPSSKEDAELAHAHGADVIIHLPMEPVKGKKSWLGPGAITTDLPDEEIRNRVVAAVENVPYAVGMNNHMGSKATADPRVMRIVLEVCKERNLFFLDSRTSSKSVVGKLAAELGVRTVSNHLFLDEVYTFEHIHKQIGRFKKHLHDHGNCVAIGHVGPPGKKTAQLLKKELPELIGQVEFVPISALMPKSMPDALHISP